MRLFQAQEHPEQRHGEAAAPSLFGDSHNPVWLWSEGRVGVGVRDKARKIGRHQISFRKYQVEKENLLGVLS